MNGLIAVGFLLGTAHATEADHLAAVATLASRSTSPRRALAQGAIWGLGHTVSLLLFAGLALAIGAAIPDTVAHTLEAAVGVMLVILGLDVIRRSRRLLRPVEGAAEAPDRRSGWRAFAVGLVHGMAGSATLVVLAASNASSLGTAVGYIALFGFGSILGMAAISVGLVLPFSVAARWSPRVVPIICLVTGVASLALGVVVFAENV